jgi:hypothetical protein
LHPQAFQPAVPLSRPGRPLQPEATGTAVQLTK